MKMKLGLAHIFESKDINFEMMNQKKLDREKVNYIKYYLFDYELNNKLILKAFEELEKKEKEDGNNNI
jgi:hypothetical protein